MYFRLNLHPGNRKYLLGLILTLLIAITCAALNSSNGQDFNLARREMLFRSIGHELLLQTGDSSSLVLPIKMIAHNEYQISFENEFTFKPAALVKATQRLLEGDPALGDYVVNVKNRNNGEVVYGFAISKDTKGDIVSCIGRKQPKAPYLINLKFKPTHFMLETNGYLLGGLPFLAFIGFIFVKSIKAQQTSLEGVQGSGMIRMGSVLFDAKNRQLKVDDNTIDLTGTETRILQIFALLPNQVIARSRLQKEIWEDEGVIVGRSLDMFISKLRKKLEIDAHLSIVVIRGKGYKLQISAE